jgi:hypothetical protein
MIPSVSAPNLLAHNVSGVTGFGFVVLSAHST